MCTPRKAVLFRMFKTKIQFLLITVYKLYYQLYHLNVYQQNAFFCHSWVINITSFNARINVTFHDFHLEWSKTCKPYDIVKLSDRCNGSNRWSKNLATGENLGNGDYSEGFCGNMTSFSVTSRCNKMRILFKSDDSETGRGFNATYKVIRDKSEFYLRFSIQFVQPFFLPSFLPLGGDVKPLALSPTFVSCLSRRGR